MNKEEKNKKVLQIEELLTELVKNSTLEERDKLEKMFRKWNLRMKFVDALVEAKEELDAEGVTELKHEL